MTTYPPKTDAEMMRLQENLERRMADLRRRGVLTTFGTQRRPSDEIVKWGKLLWAPSDWQGHMASALGVNRRTIERWVAGETTPPEGVWRDLQKIALQRINEILGAAEK